MVVCQSCSSWLVSRWHWALATGSAGTTIWVRHPRLAPSAQSLIDVPCNSYLKRMIAYLKSLRDLVAAWHQADRVRISPSTGRLLGLNPGDRFVFRGESFTMIARSVQQTATGVELVFQVASSLGDGNLVVVQETTLGTTAGKLDVPPLNLAIFDSDIVLLPSES